MIFDQETIQVNSLITKLWQMCIWNCAGIFLQPEPEAGYDMINGYERYIGIIADSREGNTPDFQRHRPANHLWGNEMECCGGSIGGCLL